MTQRHRRVLTRDIAHDERDQALAVLDGRVDLLPADFRLGRIRADEEEENIGFFDAFLDLPPPIHSGRDTFPVDPEIQVAFLQFGSEAFRKRNILARVGNKGFCHLNYLALYGDDLMIKEYFLA